MPARQSTKPALQAVPEPEPEAPKAESEAPKAEAAPAERKYPSTLFRGVSLTGNATRDPELRFVETGRGTQSVCNFGLAVQDRRLNEATGKWEDRLPTYVDISVWGRLAEHVAGSVHKGQEVTVVGDFRIRAYVTKDGKAGTAAEMRADHVAMGLTFATAEMTKVDFTSPSVTAAVEEPF